MNTSLDVLTKVCAEVRPQAESLSVPDVTLSTFVDKARGSVVVTARCDEVELGFDITLKAALSREFEKDLEKKLRGLVKFTKQAAVLQAKKDAIV